MPFLDQARLISLVEAAGTTGADVAALLRLARDLPRALRHPLDAQSARARLRQRLQNRQQRFLTVVQRSIYGFPNSPYHRLLRHAGCEFGDIRALLAAEGLEQALTTLAARGVYVTFEEFKGRQPAVRGSQRFQFREQEFDNPLAYPHFTRFTGGSRGRASRVPVSLGMVEEQAVSTLLMLEAHGVDRPQHASWWPIPINWLLVCAMMGDPIIGWYYPIHPLPPLALVLARYLQTVGRLGGVRFPLPERCDLDDPGRILAWIVARLRAGRPLVLRTTPSAGARLGVAAQQAGARLDGLTMVLGGEPVTQARKQHIEAAGAQAVVLYGSVELPGLSYSCATPGAADDVHVMLDRFALVPRSRSVVAGGPVVDALLCTSLSPTAGKLALNAELGDYAGIETRDCGCLLGQLGLRTHLSQIRSFEKLTGEGVTFARTNLQHVLEQVLPERYGSSSVDYQVAEEEVAGGITRLVLRISPSVGALDARAVVATVLAEIGSDNPVDGYHAQMWRAASSVEVRREAPIVTAGGKVLPFHLPRTTGGPGQPRH